MTRALDVYLLADHIGLLCQGEGGAKSFTYDPKWLAHPEARPLSISLPLREEPFGDRATRAVFGGMLPDGELRTRLAKHLGVSARNEFALLEIVGRECAGAISIVPRGESPLADDAGTLQPLDDARLAAILRELPRRPLFAGAELRLSLAGAQDKLAVCLVDGRVALPLGGRPTTHILKTPIEGLEASVANELFCLHLAEQLGLRTASAFQLRLGDVPVLCVERFDRHKTADGRTHRIHQEDMCQALGVPADLKYQAEGGPGFAALFGLLRDHAARPAVEFLELLRGAVFGYLIGNADAHAKNFGLLHGTHGIELAPLYDQLCTLVYPSFTTKLAMHIGSAKTFDDVDAHAWESFARKIGLAPVQVRRTCRESVDRLDAAIDGVLTGDPWLRYTPLVEQIIASIRTRADRLP